MSVVASCDALYFPNVPKDNIITLKYNDEGNALQPNTLVLFKVKTSAPALFHVLPRYGALLVADPSGCSPEGFKGGSVAFALRENYANGGRGADDDDDEEGGTTPSRRSAGGGDGHSSQRFQERFAIEYVVLHDESLAYQQVLHCLSEPARLTEAAKSVWTLTTAGAIPKVHIGTRATINLRVFLRNVVLTANDPSPIGDEQSKVVVPSNATLVDPCMQERLGSAARTPASVTSAGRRGASGSATRGSKGVADELRALRDEVQQRRDSIHQGNPSAATTSSTPKIGTAAVAAAAQGGASAPRAVTVPPSGSMSQIMSLPVRSRAARSSEKGIKVYLVVAMMFVVYVLALWMRRGRATGQTGSHLTARGADNAKRAVSGAKEPLGLPSTNSTVAMRRSTL